MTVTYLNCQRSSYLKISKYAIFFCYHDIDSESKAKNERIFWQSGKEKWLQFFNFAFACSSKILLEQGAGGGGGNLLRLSIILITFKTNFFDSLLKESLLKPN